MANQRKFHLIVNSWVDRIDILQKVGSVAKNIGQMVLAKAVKGQQVYNGSVPKNVKSVVLKLYLDEGITEYLFDKLFSKPVAQLQIGQGVKNMVIVNTPKDIECVLIETHDDFVKLGIPKIMTLGVTKKPDLSPLELLSRGVDPNGKPFVKQIQMNITDMELLKKIAKNRLFKILCYKKVIYKNMELNDSK